MAESSPPPREAAPPPSEPHAAKTLKVSQTWFLGATLLGTLLFFVFVVMPYASPRPAVSGRAVPDFNLELLDGGGRGDRVRLSDLKGKKVVLDFWASWCMPCREQTKVLEELAPSLGPDVVVLGVATSDTREDASRLLAERPAPYSNAFDEGGELARALEVTELPTLLVIDGRGTLRGASTRLLGAGEIRELLEGAE